MSQAEKIADMILALTPVELKELRGILADEWGGDPDEAGVPALLPPDQPFDEAAVALTFEEEDE